MNFIRLTAFIAVTMTLFACEQNKSSDVTEAKIPAEAKSIAQNAIETPPGTDNEQFQKAPDSAGQQKPGEKQKQPAGQQTSPPPKQDWDKKIIKTSSLNFEVKDYTAYSVSLRQKIKDLGGYIAEENQSQSDYKIENSIMIKVPVDQFDDAVAALTTGIEKINEKKISSQDVTTEFVDTRSRMEAKKQVRLRYLDLLKEAKNMAEILNVQNDINRIQEEIESATGRIAYLGHSSVFSTIHLTYFQVLDTAAKDRDMPTFANQFANAFKTGWNWIGDLFIALVSIWPLFLFAFLGVMIYKRSKVKRPKQTT